jgi:hypothetical protein
MTGGVRSWATVREGFGWWRTRSAAMPEAAKTERDLPDPDGQTD